MPCHSDAPPAPELLSIRYRAILDHLRAQDRAIAGWYEHLAEWQVRLDETIAQVQALAARVARLEALVESWDTPMPAEERLDEVARDAEAAREETCQLTDLVALLLARSGVPVPAGLTLEEIHQFVRRNQ